MLLFDIVSVWAALAFLLLLAAIIIIINQFCGVILIVLINIIDTHSFTHTIDTNYGEKREMNVTLVGTSSPSLSCSEPR